MDTTREQRIHFDADAYLAQCPSRTVLVALADKWTCLLVDALRGGPVRFGELRRRIGGITQKSLTQTLRTMERDGIVVRTVYPTVPPRVEYALSPLGVSVVGLMTGIKDWAEDHVEEILRSRERYDDLTAREPEPISSPIGRR